VFNIELKKKLYSIQAWVEYLIIKRMIIAKINVRRILKLPL